MDKNYDEMLELTWKVLEKYERMVLVLKEESLLKKSHRAYLPVREEIDLLCVDAETAIPKLKGKLRQIMLENLSDDRSGSDILSLSGRYFIVPRDFLSDIYAQLLGLVRYISDAGVTDWEEDDYGGEAEV